MKPIDRRPVQRKYPGKWVAFDKDRMTVKGVGGTPMEANEEAKKAGIKLPILFRVPDPNDPAIFIGSIWNEISLRRV
ncbi:hypothetical protein A2803_01155 [Candidatus Woesebacteria bacterium RIFCSPHIGHO2_01_FULL_44_21]|uniref:DUF5678 domain-containing protein n=1 Tax=Candidatus Woesebacteria bacterium RIFCSPHIGHO2_01_FULL_44_21 TaxID=1802503 RepID=A0A1F7YZH2_9BACT|nr:MAG: hypothetical protein A2803_01155 [Candidatus Woesebacteria bacterium RIFCSPHIGHO2_01_FULL_44_21]OGM69741.1 MAG: hypothetical protein A2897_00345 [Candidatus Woesebacteria bacterium RIFCSPLOWO2_01_FULL_44_24b]